MSPGRLVQKPKLVSHVESCSFGPLRKIEQEITTLVRLIVRTTHGVTHR